MVTVYTVWRSDDESTHIFSTQEKAEAWANTLDMPVVISTYLVDEPNHYYEVMQ